MTSYYLITIKSRGLPFTSKHELDRFYNKCINKFKFCEWSCFRSYEVTMKGRLHLHTIVSLPRYISYKTLINSVSTNRMYIHFKRFPKQDMAKVIGYIQKQQQNKFELEQILIQNEYYNYYGFQ